MNNNLERWQSIESMPDNYFKLSCNNIDCELSICNLLNGYVHVTNIHSKNRHSYTFNDEDMLFIVSQYVKSLSKYDRKNLIEFFMQL